MERAKPPARPPGSSVARSTQRLRLLMLAPCPFPTRQGTQVLIRSIAEALCGADHRVEVVAYASSGYSADLPFPVHRAPRTLLPMRSGPNWKKPGADLRIVQAALRVARLLEPDLIHAHNIEGLTTGLIVAQLTGLPLVYHAHNAMAAELPTYASSGLARAVARGVGRALDWGPPRLADAIVVFDERHRRYYARRGVEDRRMHQIPPGILQNELRPIRAKTQGRGFSSEGPTLLYAGNPDPYQNLKLLWEAMPLIQAHRPDAKLLVASCYERGAFARDHAAASSRGAVHFVRCNTLEQQIALFARASVGLCPRELWAGVPMKILNYLAAGIPVVACRGGAGQFEGREGVTTVAPTPKAFARAVVAVLDDPTRPRPTLPAEYWAESQVGCYEEVYERVLAAAVSRSRRRR